MDMLNNILKTLSHWFVIPGSLSRYVAGALFLFFAVLKIFSGEIGSYFSELSMREAEAKLQPTTAHFENLSSPGESPIIVGAINQPLGAYVHLKLRFRADVLSGYPNLFQTA